MMTSSHYAKSSSYVEPEVSKATTDDYVRKLFQTMLNPSESSTPNGQLRSCSNATSQIYVMQGCVTITTTENTTRVITVFDPEIALRNGQSKALVYEYVANGTLTKISEVLISAPSNNFSHGSLLSARLDVRNFSSQINIAGGMTGSVLNSVPANVNSITQTQLKQRTQPLDYVSSEMSHDGVSLFTITSHIGSKSRSLEDNFTSLSGRVVEYEAATAAQQGWIAGGASLGTGGTAVFDTANATTTPFTIATHSVEIVVDALATMASGSTFSNTSQWKIEVFDALNTPMYDKTRIQVNSATVVGEIKVKFKVSHTPRPIARVKLTSVSALTNCSLTTGSSIMIRAIEDVEDIPDRDVMVVVCEGINSAASLSIDAVMVVSATPSSDNAFIAGGSDRENAGADTRVFNMLKHIHKQLPRAHKANEAAVFAEAMNMIQSSKLHSDVMHAWSMPSFHKMGQMIHSTAQNVRSGIRHAHQLAEQAAPYLQQVHDLAEQHRDMGGKAGHFIGKVADMTGALQKHHQNVRKYTQHAASHEYEDLTDQ